MVPPETTFITVPALSLPTPLPARPLPTLHLAGQVCPTPTAPWWQLPLTDDGVKSTLNNYYSPLLPLPLSDLLTIRPILALLWHRQEERGEFVRVGGCW